jgi:hypothetical protein
MAGLADQRGVGEGSPAAGHVQAEVGGRYEKIVRDPVTDKKCLGSYEKSDLLTRLRVRNTKKRGPERIFMKNPRSGKKKWCRR